MSINEYYDMIGFIAKSGELKYGGIHGSIHTLVFEKEIDGFLYIADPRNQAVEVKNIENGDPFLSRWYDGRSCRCHLGRYGSLNKIKEHFVQCGGDVNVVGLE